MQIPEKRAIVCIEHLAARPEVDEPETWEIHVRREVGGIDIFHASLIDGNGAYDLTLRAPEEYIGQFSSLGEAFQAALDPTGSG